MSDTVISVGCAKMNAIQSAPNTWGEKIKCSDLQGTPCHTSTVHSMYKGVLCIIVLMGSAELCSA
jgi:hypothetical protein